MRINDIYEKYQIMPGLRQHMYRVAAVSQFVCLNYRGGVETENIIAACLLHDMGNIVKFKLGYLPELLQPQGLEYWQQAQADFKHKYGSDEHQVTAKIVAELAVPDRIAELVHAIGFAKSVENSQHDDMAKKICCYADHRVSPTGVTSLEQRMAEGVARYRANKDVTEEDMDEFNNLASYMRLIEQQIFANCLIMPASITEQSLQPLVNPLKDFEIPSQ